MNDDAQQKRIANELNMVGVSDYGLHRKVSKELAVVLRCDEHVEAAVFGRNENNWHALLAATDKRIVYIEADLLFHSSDSVSYEIVHGIDHIPTPFFDGIILYCLGKEYKVTHINKQSAIRFTKFIEDKVEKVSSVDKDFNLSYAKPTVKTVKKPKPTVPYTLSNQDISILENNFILISAKPSTSTTITFKKYYFRLYQEGLYAITKYLPSTPFGDNLSLPIVGVIVSQSGKYAARLSGNVFPVKDAARATIIADEILKNIDIPAGLNNNNDSAKYLVYKIAVDSVTYL